MGYILSESGFHGSCTVALQVAVSLTIQFTGIPVQQKPAKSSFSQNIRVLLEGWEIWRTIWFGYDVI